MDDEITITATQTQYITSKLGGKALTPCSIPFIYGIIRLFRHSLNDWQGWVLIIGALLSFIGIVTYNVALIDNKKSFRNMFFCFFGLIPYLYGCFVTFYEGFWSLKLLFISFSWSKLIIPIIWIIIGYYIVNGIYVLTEFGNSIKPPKE